MKGFDFGRAVIDPLGYARDEIFSRSGITDSVTGGGATRDAISAQTVAANQANQVLGQEFTRQNQYLSPYANTGVASLAMLNNPDFLTKDFSTAEFQQDPGYQFRLDEGQKALERSAAARGMLNSGATLKALTRYGQDYASNEFNNAYNRFNADRDRRFDRLSSLTNLGYNASQGLVNNSQVYGGGVSGNLTGLGNANAAAQIAQANRNSGLLGQAAGAIGTALAFSDERLKTNLEPITTEELREMRETLKAFKFRYKDSDHGAGDWFGVMAQDLEKTKYGKHLVFEDEQGRKQLHVPKLLSFFLATMAEAA